MPAQAGIREGGNGKLRSGFVSKAKARKAPGHKSHTIANILSSHSKAVHDGLDLDPQIKDTLIAEMQNKKAEIEALKTGEDIF